jgi:hypothetical protein
MPHTLLIPTIGAIVALNTHPFFEQHNKDSILISGDTDALSPLMVVVETLKEGKEIFDENSGMQLLQPGTYQCKCIWYSQESSQFEEAWISSRLLKLIDAQLTITDLSSLPYGTSVVFKTAPIEVSKMKVSLKQTGTNSIEKNKAVTGLVSYTSPVMQVIGTAKSDSKEPFIDPKTGKLKREISKKLIKCKYYNAVSDKFSEVQIPIEALTIVHTIHKQYLDLLEKYILKGCHLKTKSPNELFNQTIIKPTRIIYKLGNYYLEAKDYLENKTIEILIKESEEQFTLIDQEFEHLPRFEPNGNQLTIISINKDTLPDVPADNFWRIKYKDTSDNFTTRTIYNPEFFKMFTSDVDEDGEPITIDYIRATCLLRNHADRYFRIDRIQKLEVLDLIVSETIKGSPTMPVSSDS